MLTRDNTKAILNFHTYSGRVLAIRSSTLNSCQSNWTVFYAKVDGMYFVTVEEFPRWGGYIGKVSTKKLIRKYFPRSWKSIVIIPWALDSLVEYAAKSEFAIIPINKADKFAFYKSENKLLSMWHLGLPVIFSDTPAYSRVANQMNCVGAVTKDSEWFSKLEFLSVTPDFRELLATKGCEYIGKYHLHSDLMQKWDKTLHSLIAK